MLLVEIGHRGGGVFNRAVEMFQTFAEIVAAEDAGIEGGDDFLDFLGDDVAGDEIGHVEDFAEDALGEDVLNDHFLDGLDGNVGIQRAAAERAEGFKGGGEFLVVLSLLFDEGFQARANLRDFALEFLDGLFPFRDGGRGEFEEELEDVNEVVGLFQVGLVKPFAVLVKDGAVGLPEKDVLSRVADGELVLDLLVEVGGGVLGFPEAVIEAVVVEEGAVGFGGGLALALDGVFGNEGPIELPGAVFEQFLKGGSDGGFVGDAQLGKFGERVVIGAHGPLRWLEIQARHGLFVNRDAA
ncbi:MAG: hypothetical protein ABSH38_05160 [Verrucomicrobiota bacterium]